MSNSNRKALKSGVWYTVANFIMRTIGLITTPIFTRLLSHEEFGLYNNFTSWMSVLTIIITLNLESTFISARYDYEDSMDSYAFSVLSLSTLSCIIASIILNLLYIPLAKYLGMSRVYLNAMLIYILFMPAINLFQTRERFLFKYKTSVFLSLLVSVGTALISVILVTQMENKLDGRVYGSIIPSMIIGAFLYIMIARKGKGIHPEYWGYALRICLPYIPHLLSMVFLNSVDRVMITRICGAEDNALYSLAYSCGSIVSILIVSLNTAFSPWLGEKLHERNHKEIRQFSKKYIGLFMFLAIAIMLFAPELLMVLGGKTYMHAVYVMPPVACGCICQFLYTMFVNVEQYCKKTVGMAIVSASASLLNYILNALFIPQFGYIAAAYTTLVGFIWLLAFHMYLVYHYGYKDVYPYSFVIRILLLAIAVSIFVNILYHYHTIRYVVGCVYVLYMGFILFREKTLILSFIKKEK